MPSPEPSSASPFSLTVGVQELCIALNTSRSTLLRRIADGSTPDGARVGAGTKRPPERRWSIAIAIAIVRKAGRAIPQAWQPHAAAGACTCVRPAFCPLCAAAEVGL